MNIFELAFLGKKILFLSLLGFTAAFYALVIVVCRSTPNKRMADGIFQLLTVTAVAYPLIAFFSDHFWFTLGFYFLVYIATFMSFAGIFSKSLNDKSGAGALMFPGYIAMMSFMSAAMFKVCYLFYSFITG